MSIYSYGSKQLFDFLPDSKHKTLTIHEFSGQKIITDDDGT